MSHPRRARLKKLRDPVEGLLFEEQAELQKALYASLKEHQHALKRAHHDTDSSNEATDDDSDQEEVISPVKRLPASSTPLTKRPRGRPKKKLKTSTSPEPSHTQPAKKELKKKVVIIDTPSEPTVCHTPPNITDLQSPQCLRSILLPTSEPRHEPVPETLFKTVPEPIPELVSKSIPQPVHEPISELTHELLPKSIPRPIPETTPQPTSEATSQGIPQTIPQPIPELVHKSVPHLIPQPVLDPVPKSTSDPLPKSAHDPTTPKPVSGLVPEASTEVITALASLPMAVVKPLHSSGTPVLAPGDVPLDENGSRASTRPTEAIKSPAEMGILDVSQRLSGGEISKLSLKPSKTPSIGKKSLGIAKRRQPPLLIDMSTFFSGASSQSTAILLDKSETNKPTKSETNKPTKSEAIKHPVIQTAKKSASGTARSHKNPITCLPKPCDDVVKTSHTGPASSPPRGLTQLKTSDSSRVPSTVSEEAAKCSTMLEPKSHLPDDGVVVVAAGNAMEENGIAVANEESKGNTISFSDDIQKSNIVPSSFQAQRKFAQNQILPSQTASGNEKRCLDKDNCPKEMPKTEDFLLFLCLKDSGELPERLAMFNHPWTPKALSKNKQPRMKATGKGAKPVAVSSKKTTVKSAVAAAGSSEPVVQLQQACDLGAP